MLTGSYERTLDAKGRLVLPKKIRAAVGERLVLTRGLGGCVWAFPMSGWMAFSERIAGTSPFDTDAVSLARFFFASAYECGVDRAGRILLPDTLRDYAGIGSEVVIAGLTNRIEIWDENRWRDVVGKMDDSSMAKLLDRLFSRQQSLFL